jgi:hypothetical protein
MAHLLRVKREGVLQPRLQATSLGQLCQRLKTDVEV